MKVFDWDNLDGKHKNSINYYMQEARDIVEPLVKIAQTTDQDFEQEMALGNRLVVRYDARGSLGYIILEDKEGKRKVTVSFHGKDASIDCGREKLREFFLHGHGVDPDILRFGQNQVEWIVIKDGRMFKDFIDFTLTLEGNLEAVRISRPIAKRYMGQFYKTLLHLEYDWGNKWSFGESHRRFGLCSLNDCAYYDYSGSMSRRVLGRIMAVKTYLEEFNREQTGYYEMHFR